MAKFRYLGVDIDAAEPMEAEVSHGVGENMKALGLKRDYEQRGLYLYNKKWECLRGLLCQLSYVAVEHGY